MLSISYDSAFNFTYLNYDMLSCFSDYFVVVICSPSEDDIPSRVRLIPADKRKVSMQRLL